ncbi:MAG: hypothetical protein QXH12_02050 [Candidatus Caldarchaeum sp.]
MQEEDLEKVILESNPNLSKERLEEIIQSKLRSSPFLTRLGALLIILEEQRLAGEFLKKRDYEFAKISSLTSGIQNVSVIGRVLGSRIVTGKDAKSSLRLRLWDGTGSVDVVVWENFEAITPLHLGEAVAVRNGYIASSKPGQEILLHAGSRSAVEKMGEAAGLPPFDEKSFRLPEKLGEKAGKIDFSAVAVLNTGLRKIGNGVDVCELVVTDGSKELLLVGWREWAEFLSAVTAGQRFFAASVAVGEDDLFTTSNTCITLTGVDNDALSNAWRRAFTNLPLKVLGMAFDGYLVVTNGVKVMKLASPSVSDVGGCYVVERAFVINRRGIPYIYGTVATPSGCDLQLPKFGGELENVQGRLVDGVIECEIVRKTPTTIVNTKYGQKQITGFWAGCGERTINCTAWGKASAIIESQPEGTYIRFALPVVRKNKFGDVELSVDELSYVERV